MFKKEYEITQGEYGPHMCLFSGWSDRIERIIKKKGILELELNYAKGWPCGSDISFLSNLTQLKSFELIDHKVSDIRAVNGLTELRGLKINSGGNDIIDFSNFPSLERISLEWFPNAKSLFDCVTLKSVFINCCNTKELSAFKKLQNLEYLSLKSPRIERIGDVSTLKQLTFLGIYYAKYLRSLEGIEVLESLKSLEIERCNQIGNIKAISSLSKLVHLLIANNGPIESLSPLLNLKNLEEVYFHESTNIVDGDLALLKKLPRLQNVSFRERKHYNCKWEDLPMRCSKEELQRVRELLKLD